MLTNYGKQCAMLGEQALTFLVTLAEVTSLADMIVMFVISANVPASDAAWATWSAI